MTLLSYPSFSLNVVVYVSDSVCNNSNVMKSVYTVISLQSCDINDYYKVNIVL